MEQVRTAINTNNYSLALKNFKLIVPIIKEYVPNNSAFPINKANVDMFLYFADKVKRNGLQYWFKHTDVMEYWCNLPEAHDGGMYDFLEGKVTADYDKNNPKSDKIPINIAA